MRIAPEHLTFKALCALHECAQRVADEPLQPSFMLRFLLAYIYAVSDAPLWLVKQTWRDLQAPDATHMTGEMAKYTRATAARTSFQALARHCGHDLTPAGLHAFNAFMNRNGTAEQRAHQLRLDAFRAAADEQRAKVNKRRERH